MDMNDLPDQGQVTTWLSVLFGAILAGLGIRAKFSRSSLEVTKDRVESSLYERLVVERDRALADAREAWARRALDAERILILERNEARLSTELSHIRSEFTAFKRFVLFRFPEAKEFIASEHGDLDEEGGSR